MASDKELKLSRLECAFYKACSAVWTEGVELREIRNSLVRELRQLEVKEKSDLIRVTEDLQVC